MKWSEVVLEKVNFELELELDKIDSTIERRSAIYRLYEGRRE